MPTWQRTYFTALAFATAFVIAYVGVDYARVPRLFYDGILRDWSLVPRTGPVPMGYVGLWLWALCGGAVVGGATWLLTRLKKTPAQPLSLQLAIGWTLAAVVIAISYYVWHNWPFAIG